MARPAGTTEMNRGRLAFLVLVGLTLATYISFVMVAATHTHNRVGLGGSPLFYDFSVFHTVGAMANEGHAAESYDDARMIAAERAAFPGNTLRLPWNYPPTFQVMMMPLGAMPYVAAWLVWSGILYGFYVLLSRRLADAPDPLVFLLLAPGAAVNLFFGQNGILSTVLLGGGVLLLGSRPLLAGMLLGLLSYKPQLAVLAPFALMAGREWRALGAAIVSQLALILVSVALLGAEPWFAFLYKLAHPAAVFSSSSSDWRAIPSVMIFARTLGLGDAASSALHWTVAAIAAAFALWTWHKTRDGFMRMAVLAAATLLVTPYLRSYDLLLLILPVAVMLRSQTGTIEKLVIFAAWLMPGVLMFMKTPVQVAPLASVAVIGLLVLRLWSQRTSPDTA